VALPAQPTKGKYPIHPNDWTWPLWPLVPLYPYGQRRTLRREVVKDTIWIFEQVQGIFYVVVPIRMTVVKLDQGGLLVYAPIAPTNECVRLINELVATHGAIKYIILPTVSGLEHKVFVAPFAQRFPTAQVFVAPQQWSFPINLPLSWLGFPPNRTHPLPEDSRQTPFADEFDYAMFQIDLGQRFFGEVALYHRRSHTLLVTDTVLSIPAEPPEVVQLDPYPLLFHAKDQAATPVKDDPATRCKGWQRIALFACYFRPLAMTPLPLGKAIRHARYAADRSHRAYFGIFPFSWSDSWQHSFAALHGHGRLLVAPILRTLILNRAPQTAIAWADQVACWNFERIIPAHFTAPISASPQQFRQAFAFLEADAPSESYDSLLAEDFTLLRELEANFSRAGILPPRGA